MVPRRSHRRWCAAATITVVAMALAAPSIAARQGGRAAPAVAITAAFLFNFAKFTEWPALPPDAPLVFCVVGDDDVADELVETVRGQSIGGHALEVREPGNTTRWAGCHLLFIADDDTRRLAGDLTDIKRLPVLTVSDAAGFARSDGLIELYIENGRMRFAINVDAVGRSRLRLSSRLLGLARIVRASDVQ